MPGTDGGWAVIMAQSDLMAVDIFVSRMLATISILTLILYLHVRTMNKSNSAKCSGDYCLLAAQCITKIYSRFMSDDESYTVYSVGQKI